MRCCLAWFVLALRVAAVALVVAMPFGASTAQAQDQPDFNIQTPMVRAVQARMDERFDTVLRPYFDNGALGMTADGRVVVRDPSMLAPEMREWVFNAMADENRDRRAIYREIAFANGHPEWEGQVRATFARQWVLSARAGWWYQQGGVWRQK